MNICTWVGLITRTVEPLPSISPCLKKKKKTEAWLYSVFQEKQKYYVLIQTNKSIVLYL